MNINLIVIRTANIDALSEFYKSLGIKFEYHKHGKGDFHYSAKLNSTVFEIYPLLEGQLQIDNSTRLGFDVRDLNSIIQVLEKRGVCIDRYPKPSKWGYFAVVLDPDGRKIELKELNSD